MVSPAIPPHASGQFPFLAPALGPNELGRLGQYRVLNVLGQGGMGMVFQAEDLRLQRTVALKVMLPEMARRAEAHDRFLREARATAAIEHDHIVTIFQVDEANGVPFLAMQLLKGMSLEDYLKKAQQTGKPLSLKQVLKLGREIAKGLQAAHERGLIHRDIKPANIWLDAGSGGRVKILDFGLARGAGDTQLTQSGMIVGTAAYMAPEQARGEKVDARADLYSLGCVLYRLCTGRVPFDKTDLIALLMAAASETPTPVRELNPQVPAELAELIDRLLAKQPEDRPAPARQVADSLAKIERHIRTVEDTTEPEMPSIRLRDNGSPTIQVAPRRRRWLGLVAVALLLAGGLAGGIAYLAGNRPGQATPFTQQAAMSVPETAKSLPEATNRVPEPTKPIPIPVEPSFEEWLAGVPKLPLDAQIKEVARKLEALNRGFDGRQMEAHISGDHLEAVTLCTDQVTDLRPLRALTGLRSLTCNGSSAGRGKLKDLTNLQGLQLTRLSCGNNPIEDLAPLRGLPLTYLDIQATKVCDLAPLALLLLKGLVVSNCPIADLAPIRGLTLEALGCKGLSPDVLATLKGLPLKQIDCDAKPPRVTGLLKSLWLLERINNQPVIEFWKKHDATHATFLEWIETTKQLPAEKQAEAVKAKIRERNNGNDGNAQCKVENNVVKELKLLSNNVGDLSAVRALPNLRVLWCHSSGHKGKFADLTPLVGLSLQELACWNNPITDLSPLRGMPLTSLNLSTNPINDLTPLKGMKLRMLYVDITNVHDLTPLAGMPLQDLRCNSTKVRDLTRLKKVPTLRVLRCDPEALRGIEVAQLFPKLKTLNDKPAAAFGK